MLRAVLNILDVMNRLLGGGALLLLFGVFLFLWLDDKPYASTFTWIAPIGCVVVGVILMVFVVAWIVSNLENLR